MKLKLLGLLKLSYLELIKQVAKNSKEQHQQVVYLLSFPNTSGYIIDRLYQQYKERLIICYTKSGADLAAIYKKKGCITYNVDSPLNLLKNIVPLLKGATIILCDNYFALLGGIDFLPSTKIVQLWHANGAIKKFGLEAKYVQRATRVDKKRYQEVYRRYTHYVVSSPKMASIFEKSYQQKMIFLPFGYPPTDQYFRQEKKSFEEIRKLFSNKKLLLYVPTYREIQGDYSIDFKKLVTDLPDWQILVQLHPHDMTQLKKIKSVKGIITDFKGYKIQELFPIIDCLVTDYSSIPFEYSLSNPTGKIRYFWYDYELYDKTVGIQENFATQKNIVRTQEDLVVSIEKGTDDLKPFNKEWNTYVTGNAVAQLVKWVNEQYEN